MVLPVHYLALRLSLAKDHPLSRTPNGPMPGVLSQHILAWDAPDLGFGDEFSRRGEEEKTLRGEEEKKTGIESSQSQVPLSFLAGVNRLFLAIYQSDYYYFNSLYSIRTLHPWLHHYRSFFLLNNLFY